MTDILIKYRDGNGEITERLISDPHPENATTIEAFCHLRKDRRSFKIDRIVHALNPDTGEVLNPYNLLGDVPAGTRQTLESLIWRVMPAVKALKFFTLSTRGLAKREKERVVQFLQEVADVSAYSKEEIAEWVSKLWCGNIYAYRDGDVNEYAEALKSIPSGLLDRCRDYALLIAGGSGRAPLDPSWLERINSEFSPTPVVKVSERSKQEQ